jgi:hypothetical protein
MKYRFMILTLCALTIVSLHAYGQYKYTPVPRQQDISLTGSLHYDMAMNAGLDFPADSARRKPVVVKKTRYSPLAAGLYSAVLPGAGQFYTKSYWQSAAFFGAEVLAWVVYASYEKKGDQQTNAFQQYADLHWSVVTYAQWINANFGRSINIVSNPNNTLKSWQQVDWADLNAAEDQIAGDQSIQPTGFTHKLAPHGDQQFYEMIGKLSQFGGGWDDAATFQAGGYTKADVLANNGIGNVSPRFLAYRDMRGKANSYYNIGTTVSYIIVANHLLSALEAALNASNINHRIQLQGHIQSRSIYGTMVEFVPTLNVNYEL